MCMVKRSYIPWQEKKNEQNNITPVVCLKQNSHANSCCLLPTIFSNQQPLRGKTFDMDILGQYKNMAVITYLWKTERNL